MRRFTVLFLMHLILAVLVSVAPAVCEDQQETAIIHFSQLKEAKLEGTARNLRFLPMLGTTGQTPYIRLFNELPVKREVTIQVLDLTEPEYDLYIDGNFIATKTREQIESGFPVFLSGTYISDAYRNYYTKLHQRAIVGVERYKTASGDDASVCKAILHGVANWTTRIEKGDERKRTVSIVVTPANRPFSLPGGGIDSITDFEESVRKLGDAVHIARRDLKRLVSNDIYRNDTLNIITPVGFSLTVQGKLTPGKKVAVIAHLTNGTDRILKGRVKLSVPSGIKVREIAPNVKMDGYNKPANARFEVSIPKSFTANYYVSAVAELVVQDVPMKMYTKVDSNTHASRTQ